MYSHNTSAKIYMVHVNNGNTWTISEIYLNTTKALEQYQWRRSGVFIVSFEYITPFSSVSFVAFEQVNDCWVILLF